MPTYQMNTRPNYRTACDGASGCRDHETSQRMSHGDLGIGKGQFVIQHEACAGSNQGSDKSSQCSTNRCQFNQGNEHCVVHQSCRATNQCV